AKIQRDETRMHAEMERSEASDVATIKAAMEAMAESARREQEELLRDEKEERYTIQEDERRLRRNITRQSAELSLDVSMQHVQQRGKEDAQRELDMLRVALESTAVETTSRARLNLVVTEELRARDSLCSDEASERAMHAAEERRERVEVATWDSEQQLRLFEQLMDLARDEQQHRAKIQRDETRMHAEMERSEASDVATIKAAMEAMAESARREQEELLRDEKEERYTIQEDERRLRRNITRQSAELSLDVSMQHVQQRGKEDAQRELDMLRVALESTAVETTSRARLNLVVTEELRARDSLCSDEASERAMHAAEERRERVEVATWDSEQQLRLFEQLMDLARDEQQHRAKIQRDETRMHAEMERSEASDVATIKAAMEAMAESARREQEELLRDEKEERYTIQEDERRLRRNITRQSAELSLDVSMQHVQQRGKEDAQRELDMLRVALESTAVETTSRARLNLVVTEELRARDSLCSDEASERAMHAAEERRERVEVATWDSEQQLRLFEQLMDLARDEQQHRAKIQRDETRMHAEMERSEASDVATIKAAMEAMAESARREQEELLRDEKEERYTIQEDERRLRRNITRQSAELSLDVSMQHVQQRGKEDAQRELDMLRVALESTAVETTSRARLNLVVTEELRARDSLCSDEASERAMHAAEERRERVEVATWDSEQQLRLFEQLMDLARDEQQHRAKIQRDETRMHAEMERSVADGMLACGAQSEGADSFEVASSGCDCVFRPSGADCASFSPDVCRGGGVLPLDVDFPVGLACSAHGSTSAEAISVDYTSFLRIVGSDALGESSLWNTVDDDGGVVFGDVCAGGDDVGIDVNGVESAHISRGCSTVLNAGGVGATAEVYALDEKWRDGTTVSAEPPRIPASRICRTCFSTDTSRCARCGTMVCSHCIPSGSFRQCCTLHHLTIINKRCRVMTETRVHARWECRRLFRQFRLEQRMRRRRENVVNTRGFDVVVLTPGQKGDNSNLHEVKTPPRVTRRFLNQENDSEEDAAWKSHYLESWPSDSRQMPPCGLKQERFDEFNDAENSMNLKADNEPKTERKRATAFFVPLGNNAEPRRPKPPTPRNYVPGIIHNCTKAPQSKRAVSRMRFRRLRRQNATGNTKDTTLNSAAAGRNVQEHRAASSSKPRPQESWARQRPVQRQGAFITADPVRGITRSGPASNSWRRRNFRTKSRSPAVYGGKASACNFHGDRCGGAMALGRTYYDGNPVRSKGLAYVLDEEPPQRGYEPPPPTRLQSNRVVKSGVHSGEEHTRMGCQHEWEPDQQCVPLFEEFHESSSTPPWRPPFSRDPPPPRRNHRNTNIGGRTHRTLAPFPARQRLCHPRQRSAADLTRNASPGQACSRFHYNPLDDVDRAAFVGGPRGAQRRPPTSVAEPCITVHLFPPSSYGGGAGTSGRHPLRGPTARRHSSVPTGPHQLERLHLRGEQT
ncbi:hypothetical protein, conserved, (fragment), partial [Trypanosoma brucei gambiense DAL972]